MNTLTHVVAAAAVLARPDQPRRNRIVLFGALVPDLSIYVMCVWALATGNFDESLWSDIYWTEPWQTMGAVTNSVPLALLILSVGLVSKSVWLKVFAGALLIHAALDFPLHADDAHRHFWPVTDWRFKSPVSYWDPDHYGLLGQMFDSVVLFASLAVLWRKFDGRKVRLALFVFAVLGLIWTGLGLWFSFR